MGRPYGLPEGQTALFPTEGLEVTYLRVVENGRCPVRTDSEWPGELVIEYEVVKNGRGLGTFDIGSNGTVRIIDEYIVGIWDWDGKAILVRQDVEEMTRTTSSASPHNCTPGTGSFSDLR